MTSSFSVLAPAQMADLPDKGAYVDSPAGDPVKSNKKLDDLESSTSRDDDPILSHFTEREQRSIVHKIDRRLIPICGVMYCISLLDRTNLGNANIAG